MTIQESARSKKIDHSALMSPINNQSPDTQLMSRTGHPFNEIDDCRKQYSTSKPNNEFELMNKSGGGVLYTDECRNQRNDTQHT